jgi:hypothetical protein
MTSETWLLQVGLIVSWLAVTSYHNRYVFYDVTRRPLMFSNPLFKIGILIAELVLAIVSAIAVGAVFGVVVGLLWGLLLFVLWKQIARHYYSKAVDFYVKILRQQNTPQKLIVAPDELERTARAWVGENLGGKL